MYQMSVWASRTFLSAIGAVELLFPMPLGVLEVFQRRMVLPAVLARLQVARFGFPFRLFDQQNANATLAKSGWRLQQFDLAPFVDAGDQSCHLVDSLPKVSLLSLY